MRRLFEAGTQPGAQLMGSPSLSSRPTWFEPQNLAYIVRHSVSWARALPEKSTQLSGLGLILFRQVVVLTKTGIIFLFSVKNSKKSNLLESGSRDSEITEFSPERKIHVCNSAKYKRWSRLLSGS